MPGVRATLSMMGQVVGQTVAASSQPYYLINFSLGVARSLRHLTSWCIMLRCYVDARCTGNEGRGQGWRWPVLAIGQYKTRRFD